MTLARRMRWWIAVPLGVAVGLALAVALDRAAAPAGAQGGSGFTLTTEQLRINQRIAQQGVKRANRANARLDALTPGAAGPTGPPGPAGPGAARMAFSGEAGAAGQKVLDLAGVTLTVSCVAGGGGETNLVIEAGLQDATTVVGTSSTDQGTDIANPSPPDVSNFQVQLPAGPANALGGNSAPDGAYSRSVASVLFIGPGRTLSLDAVVVADGAADRCSFNGVATPA